MSGSGKLMRYLSLLYSLRNSAVPISNHEGKSCVGISSEQVCVKVLCSTATA